MAEVGSSAFREAWGGDLTALAFATAKLLPTMLWVPPWGVAGGREGRPLRIALAMLFAGVLAAASPPPPGPALPAGALGLLAAALTGAAPALVARTVLGAFQSAGGFGDALAGLTDDGDDGAGSGPLRGLVGVLAGYVYFASGAIARTVSTLAALGVIPRGHALAALPAILTAGVALAADVAAPWIAARLAVDALAVVLARATVGGPLRLGDLGGRRAIALLLTAALVERLADRLAHLLVP